MKLGFFTIPMHPPERLPQGGEGTVGDKRLMRVLHCSDLLLSRLLSGLVALESG